MVGMKFIVLSLLIGSISAANFRDLSSRVLVGSILGYPWMNETHVYQWTGEMFNKLTCENEMKWEVTEPTRGQPVYGPADVIVEYGIKHNMKIRGHTLVWHNQIPAWLNTLNKTELHDTMVKRITSMMSRYKGKIYAWDVVNEAIAPSGKSLRPTLWLNNLGEGYISESFHLARKTDPATKLYINDYNTEGNNSKTVALFNLVRKLKGQGVPIDGVGFQCHFHAGKVPADFEKVLRWFTTLGVDVAITEMDIAVSAVNEQQLQQQAEDYARIYKSCEDVPRCVSVTAWGFTDKFSWRKAGKPCMWDSNFNPKPAVNAVKAVLK